MIKPKPWDEGKISRFVKDWNEGLELTAMSEKYGHQRPSMVAARLRRKGFQLMERRGGRQDLSRCFPKNRPEDLRAMW